MKDPRSGTSGSTQLLSRARLKRWAPLAAVGAGMFVLGLILGATLFARSAPCADGALRRDARPGVTTTEAAKPAPATEVKPAATAEVGAAAPGAATVPEKRSRARSPSGPRSASGSSSAGGKSEGGHF